VRPAGVSTAFRSSAITELVPEQLELEKDCMALSKRTCGSPLASSDVGHDGFEGLLSSGDHALVGVGPWGCGGVEVYGRCRFVVTFGRRHVVSSVAVLELSLRSCMGALTGRVIIQ
jgi:hypothetical protein